ncbi:MAG TPA: nucleotidyltransferase family protein [Hyphomicrobium sp.]|nr:nucleotidyltransferase family protein [Hyphomicrobium sp.]
MIQIARPTTAFVLAAGLGTRMRPLTDTTPKPLVRLAGKALIDHILDRLAATGIVRAVVNVHHHADQLQAHLARRTTPKIVISNEQGMLLETGGGVLHALPLIGSDPFIIANSDSVWIEGAGSNLGRLLGAWDSARMDALLLLAPVATSLGYEGRGDFFMDASGRLKRRTGALVAPFVFAGVSIAHPRLFDGAPCGKFSLNVPWDAAIERDRVFGVRLEGTWMHVGDPQALKDAEARLREDVPSTGRPGARP